MEGMNNGLFPVMGWEENFSPVRLVFFYNQHPEGKSMNVFILEYHTKTYILHSNKMHFQIPEVGNTCVLMVITYTRCRVLESLVSRGTG